MEELGGAKGGVPQGDAEDKQGAALGPKEWSIAALLDVLAYRDWLERDTQSGAPEFKERLTKALSALADVNAATVAYRAISDTIILTCSSKEHFLKFLQTVKKLVVAFLEQGLQVRGGVAYSQHFESGTITYSRAIALAYAGESKTALWPRVIVDESVMGYFRESEEDMKLLREARIIVEWNGTIFIDVVSTKEEWEAVYKAAKATYESQKEALRGKEDAFMKHFMFHEYLMAHPLKPVDAVRFIALYGGV